MEGKMEGLFTSAAAEDPVVVEKAEGKKKENSEMKSILKAAMQETLASDPDFMKKVRSASSTLEVVNTLGGGDRGNLVYSGTDETGKRIVTPTSTIVGYRVRNIGEEAIPYRTEEYTKDPTTGEWVGQEVEKVMAPGEIVNLPRMYMTLLCSRPEFSFTLANGKLVGHTKRKGGNIKEILSAYYFIFNRQEGAAPLQVNDDEVKLSVTTTDAAGNTVVKPEFEASFGYLNNPKKAEKRGTTKSGQKVTLQDVNANYVRKLLAQNGIMA